MPIIPIAPLEIDPRDALMYEIADMINESIASPGEIHVLELADMIDDTIENDYAVKLEKT